MHFEITIINPTTGEPESKNLTEANCWELLCISYSKATPDKKIKPVNFKIELILGSGE